MGQAKLRGSFEDRKALALEKNAVLAERLRVDAYLDDLCRIRQQRLNATDMSHRIRLWNLFCKATRDVYSIEPIERIRRRRRYNG